MPRHTWLCVCAHAYTNVYMDMHTHVYIMHMHVCERCALPTEESDVAKWKISRPVADISVMHFFLCPNADQAPARLQAWLLRIKVNCLCWTFPLEDWHLIEGQKWGHAAQSLLPSPVEPSGPPVKAGWRLPPLSRESEAWDLPRSYAHSPESRGFLSLLSLSWNLSWEPTSCQAWGRRLHRFL